MADLLVLGGTSFIGRHLVAQAAAAGHSVAVFHRGRTAGDLPDGVRRFTGDRGTGDYASIADSAWDAVVDVSNYVPRQVAQAADALGEVGHYVLVSTVSAYDPAGADDRTESAPLQPTPAEPTEVVTPAVYGALKADCERAAQERWGDRLAVVRPTYVAGPFDATERFTWWVRRLAEPRELPLPVPDGPLQVIDARDLAAFLLLAATERLTGPFDGVGPAQPMDVTGFCRAFAPDGSPPPLVEVPATAAPALGLPLVVAVPAAWPLFRRSGERARAAGLTLRPLAETATDMRAWDDARGRPTIPLGPDEAAEQAALASA